MFERHGLSKVAEYSVWHGIKDRCLNPNSCNWSRYGARGIKICDEWKDSFPNFYRDMGPRPTAQHSIERIDNDGHYEPGNCIWITPLEQAQNRSTNITVTIDGKVFSPKEAAAYLGMSIKTLHTRLYRGKSLYDPKIEKNIFYEYKGEPHSLEQLSKLSGIDRMLIRGRIAAGWSVEKAITIPASGIRKYPFKGELLTVAQICDRYNLKSYNFRYHLNNGKQPEEIVEFLTRNG